VAAANPNYWIGGTTGNWSEPSNWSNNNVAGYNHDDDVTIVHNDGVSRTVNFDLPFSNPIYTNSLTIDLTGGAGSATNTLLIPDGAALYPSLEIVGDSGRGAILQSGGIHTSSQLILGGNTGSLGTYTLSSGQFSTSNAQFGFYGTAAFNQTGGSAVVSQLYLGAYNGGVGNYSLSGGTLLSGSSTYLGVSGNGTFTQTGGTHTVTNNLYLGYDSELNGSSTGVYNLGGNSALTAANEYIGYQGHGTFNQTSGTNTVNANPYFPAYGNIYVGYQAGSTGAYNLSGGTVTAQNVFLGSGYYYYNNSLGTLSVSGSSVLNVLGTLEVYNSLSGITFSGGTINVDTLQLDVGASQLNWTAGTLHITGYSGAQLNYLLPDNTELTATRTLQVDYSANLSNGSLTVNGGNFSAGSFINNGSVFFKSGSFVMGSLYNQSNGLFSISTDHTVSLSGGTNAGIILLGGGVARMSGIGNLTNTGTIRGEGIIQTQVSNNAGGEIRAENGKTLLFTASNGDNLGQINLQGGTAEFSQPLTNGSTGQIVGRGMLKVGGAGLTNEWYVVFP
jgi:hypothetical protein